MVLESIINPEKTERRPLMVFGVSVVYTFVAIIFSNLIFPSEASILTVSIITMIFLPFFQKLFVIEEKKENFAARRKTKKNLFMRHIRLIEIFGAFFIGVIVATSFVYIVIPSNTFDLQTNVIKSFSASTGYAINTGDFSRFFVNNTQVMVITYILSILFGAGAVFILAWNASVVGVYIGVLGQSFVTKGYPLAAAYAASLPLGFGAIFLHGVPEVLAYFLAAVAGGVLSVGIVKEKWKGKEFKFILRDSLKFLLLAEMLIFIAAIIEAA